MYLRFDIGVPTSIRGIPGPGVPGVCFTSASDTRWARILFPRVPDWVCANNLGCGPKLVAHGFDKFGAQPGWPHLSEFGPGRTLVRPGQLAMVVTPAA